MRLGRRRYNQCVRAHVSFKEFTSHLISQIIYLEVTRRRLFILCNWTVVKISISSFSKGRNIFVANPTKILQRHFDTVKHSQHLPPYKNSTELPFSSSHKRFFIYILKNSVYLPLALHVANCIVHAHWIPTCHLQLILCFVFRMSIAILELQFVIYILNYQSPLQRHIDFSSNKSRIQQIDFHRRLSLAKEFGHKARTW